MKSTGIYFVPLTQDDGLSDGQVVITDSDGRKLREFFVEHFTNWELFAIGQIAAVILPLGTAQLLANSASAKKFEYNSKRELSCLTSILRGSGDDRKTFQAAWPLEIWAQGKSLSRELPSSTNNNVEVDRDTFCADIIFDGSVVPEIRGHSFHLCLVGDDKQMRFKTKSFPDLNALNHTLTLLGVEDTEHPRGIPDSFNRLVMLDLIPISYLFKLGFEKLLPQNSA